MVQTALDDVASTIWQALGAGPRGQRAGVALPRRRRRYPPHARQQEVAQQREETVYKEAPGFRTAPRGNKWHMAASGCGRAGGEGRAAGLALPGWRRRHPPGTRFAGGEKVAHGSECVLFVPHDEGFALL